MKKDNYYGIHTSQIILEQFPESVINLYIQEGKNPRLESLVQIAKKHGLKPAVWPKAKLDDLVQGAKHQGIIIQSRSDLLFKNNSEANLKSYFDSKLEKNQNHKFFILLLDEIQDPQNLGACIRSAEAMGVDFVVTPQRNSAIVNNTVCKASAGAALFLPVFQVTNLARTMDWLKQQGVWLYGTGMSSSKSLSNLDLTDSIGLVMGAEGTGIRKLTRDLCDDIFTIPMSGKTESLNVSVATGISLYEVIRQRSV